MGRELAIFAAVKALPLAQAETRVLAPFFLAAILSLFAASSLVAKQHPVPLDKNTDAAKCIECHEEKTKGKSVHSAIAGGCMSCHEVRVNKDITRIKLITATPVKLCIQCHADKDASQINGHVHSPAIHDCLKCHDPHTADNKNQLLKSVSGTAKDDNLCLSCHTTGLNVSAKGSRHAALDGGCDTCHITHKTGPDPGREFQDHLTKNAPALCLDCHDVKDAAMAKAHQNQLTDKFDCLECHDPHQSESKHLMRAYLHNPFQEGQCDSCHLPAKDGKIVLTAASTKEVCSMCHEEAAAKIQAAPVGHKGAKGDCTVCHSPHGSDNPGYIRPDPVTACLDCHKQTAAEIKKTHPHQPASAQSCSICHEPHGGENAHMLRTKNVNQLCLECHGPDSSPVKLEKEHMVTIFNGKVKLPEDYFKKVVILPLKFGQGHPTEHHPVQDVTNPATKAVTQISCLTCHQAHGSAKPGLLVKDQANNMDFCKTCHADGFNLKDTRTVGK